VLKIGVSAFRLRAPFRWSAMVFSDARTNFFFGMNVRVGPLETWRQIFRAHHPTADAPLIRLPHIFPPPAVPFMPHPPTKEKLSKFLRPLGPSGPSNSRQCPNDRRVLWADRSSPFAIAFCAAHPKMDSVILFRLVLPSATSVMFPSRL